MKTILVTGGNGQLGSELRDLAASYPGYRFIFTDIGELGLLDERSVTKFFEQHQIDFVINCAAYTAVDKAELEPALCQQINADVVRMLARLAKAKSIRFIQVSTDYVFDGEANQPIAEDAIPNPISAYGKSKLDGEQYLLEELADAYIVRTAWVYSTYGKNFVKTIGNLLRQRSEIGIVADQFGTPTYARDLAIAIMGIVDSIARGVKDVPGIYHYTNEGALTWYDFGVFIRDFYGLPCEVKPLKTSEYKTAAVRPKFSVLDKTKIKQTFALSIPHWSTSLRECLKKMEL